MCTYNNCLQSLARPSMYLGKKVSYYTLSFRERVKCIVKEQRRFEISQHGFYGAIYQSKLSPDMASYNCMTSIPNTVS